MQDRLNQNDVTNRVNVEDPQRVRDAVLALFTARYPGENLNRLARAFDDFRALFEGRFSGYEMEIEDIHAADPKDRLVGCLVGTADLIGQMSDRMYLEKCRQFLYREFVLGNIARERLPDGREVVRYASGDDLIVKTPGFYEYVARDRIDRKLGAVIRYAEAHFDGPNLYQSQIDRNMGFLRRAISTADLSPLRRYCYSPVQALRRP